MVQVTDKDDLHAAEWTSGMWPESLQSAGDAVEEVCAHHRRLVDDETVEIADDAGVPARPVHVILDRFRCHAGAESEQPVDRHTANVECCNTSRRGDDSIALPVTHNHPDQGRFSRSCLARKEEILS